MILLQLRDYIRERGKVSQTDICNHFDIAPSALAPMLKKWQQKGVILLQNPKEDCEGDCDCSCDEERVYVWQGQ